MLHNYTLYYAQLMERDSSACRHIVLQCLNADKMEALYSTADKMKKKWWDLVSPDSVVLRLSI